MTSAALPKAEGWRLARLLARHGWALARRVVRGETRFVVTRRGGVVKAGGRASRPPSGTALAAGGVVAELALESPEGAAAGAKVSVVPDFRLRLVGSHALTEAERRGISDLSSGLCLLLDAMKPKAAASLVQAQTESHEGAQGFDLLLRTTLACNQRCPFCCVPLSRKRIDPASLEAELSALARRLGSRGTLTLSGGEPLADPRLPGLLESARAKGIRRFVLQTNAVGLERPGMIEKLTELGVRHFFVSFHSHKSAAYDRITGSKGLYPRAVRALMKLFSGGGYGVTCNVVVNAWNYRDLPGLMIFLAGLARKAGRRRMGSLDVFFSMINGVGVAKAPRSAMDLAEAAPY
ncbi:MAG: radical SAM protein, partial [Elusimicrobia bacterium]|nr:radical SAM protein [Elusimicrobiota bacterium]